MTSLPNEKRSLKGFIFTLDVTFAAIVLALFLLTLVYFSGTLKTNNYDLYTLQKLGGDTLIVLDKSNVLSTLNETIIENKLNNMLPDNYGWNMGIYSYTYSNGFDLSKNMSLGSDYTNVKQVVETDREIPIFENSHVVYYTIVRLRLWLK